MLFVQNLLFLCVGMHFQIDLKTIKPFAYFSETVRKSNADQSWHLWCLFAVFNDAHCSESLKKSNGWQELAIGWSRLLLVGLSFRWISLFYFFVQICIFSTFLPAVHPFTTCLAGGCQYRMCISMYFLGENSTNTTKQERYND